VIFLLFLLVLGRAEYNPHLDGPQLVKAHRGEVWLVGAGSALWGTVCGQRG
jgi:hypothetical protein